MSSTSHIHIDTDDTITDPTGIMSGPILTPIINASAAKTAMGLGTVTADIATLQAQVATILPLFVQTSDVTITNTVSETSILGTGSGSKTLSAGFFNTTGKVLRIKLAGIYSTPAIVASSVTIKIKLGGTVLASGTTTALATGASGLRFFGEANITCRTSGSSGVLGIDSAIVYNVSGSDIPIIDPLNNGGSTITAIDLTGALAFDITATWDSATTTRIAKSTMCIMQGLN